MFKTSFLTFQLCGKVDFRIGTVKIMGVLCEPLQKILDAELAAGNEIAGADSGAFSEIDYIVYLKFPFGQDYAGQLQKTDVRFYANHDAHYNLGESYSSAEHRQAIEAPFAEKV